MDMRTQFADTVTDLLEQDLSTALVLAEISTQLFTEAALAHPERVVNVGIREQLLVSAAAGIALTGLRPVVHTFGAFLVERAFEQVKLDFGHQDVGGVLVSVGGSFDWPAGGRTHMAPGDVALIDTLPGWTIHVPGHPDEADLLLRDAVAGAGQVYVRLSALANTAPQPVTPGRFHVVRRGAAGTVVAVGPTLDAVLEATADRDVTVLYAATVRPFDAATLRETLARPAVAVVEPYLKGTSSAAASEALWSVPHRLLALGVGADDVRRYGTAAEHLRLHRLDASGVHADLDAFFGF